MNTQQQAAQDFALRWRGRGYEKGESQIFWIELLQKVLGVADPGEWISFEDKVMLDHTSFIDGHIQRTHVLIEQKSLGKDLRAPIRQSDGSMLTPFQQAKRYSAELPYSKRPRWVVTCNFAQFLIYDMEQPNGEPEVLLLENLEKEYYRLKFLVDTGDEHIQREMEVSLKAGELVGLLYDALLAQYDDPSSDETLRSLNILCVRLVFCLYAEDAGVFPRRDMFHDYLASFQVQNVRLALKELFRWLNTPPSERDPYAEENLKEFPYVNGGLFADDSCVIPRFSEEIVRMLMDKASLGFDWSEISPTIFGAVFESTLNPDTRRKGGMHYTSIQNIHKVIDPLFFSGLKEEFQRIVGANDYSPKQRRAHLQALQNKIASLTFLDPACGSGNFLTETFISLRRLENEILKLLCNGQYQLGFEEQTAVKVSISQFYGIEINDFAATVAKTALWIAEHQMLRASEMIVQHDLDFLPLKTYNNIREGDALKLEWDIVEDGGDKVVDIYAIHTNIVEVDSVAEPVAHYGNINLHTETLSVNKPEPVRPTRQVHYDYIMGNPPFVGARMMSPEQKEGLTAVFGPKWKNVGNLDFVCAWYKKAVDLMRGTDTRAALVSTNSVCQGDSVATLWQPLMEKGAHIDFAHTTFRWDSESEKKAAVSCVIVGFSVAPNNQPRQVFYGEKSVECGHINAYLMPNGPEVFVGSRSHPICPVPEIGIGNKPIDGGHYLFTQEEMEAFIEREPQSAPFFKPWYGSDEFINRRPRYCLWLGDCTPAQLRSMPHCYERVIAVRDFRLSSKSPGTVKLADRPTRFHVENMPAGNYLLVPEVSSEKRRYVPIGFMSPDVLCSNLVKIIPDASLYHFGILTSNVHMAWMRAVCGRLESRYRYSKDVVYNNFPWPTPTDEQRQRIEQTAQAILDARALYPDSSLADLYDEAVMPAELRRAHQQNDRAVMAAYGFPVKAFTEQDCVAALMKMYQELTSNK